jgi:hypothetical protein
VREIITVWGIHHNGHNIHTHTHTHNKTRALNMVLISQWTLLLLCCVCGSFLLSVSVVAGEKNEITSEVNAMVGAAAAEFDAIMAQESKRQLASDARSSAHANFKTDSVFSSATGKKRAALPRLDETPGRKSNLVSILEEFDVSAPLQQEILSMSSAMTPKEDIVRHVLTHYPSITSSAASDIVTAVHIDAGRTQPRLQDFEKHRKLDSIHKLNDFNKKWKDRHDAKESIGVN